jgi:hypothetical protein
MNEKQESWATRTISSHLANTWYGVAEEFVEVLRNNESSDPITELAKFLENWVSGMLSEIQCPKCDKSIGLEGIPLVIVMDFVDDVDWLSVAEGYEEDLEREGGTKLADGSWAWYDEVDGGEWDDDED